MQRAKQIPFYFCLALLAYMPFHIFLSQSLSLLTGGLEVWKVAKDILLAAMTVFAVCLVWWSGRANRLFYWLLGGAIAYGVLHMLLWKLHPDIYQQSTILGFTFNMRLPTLLMLGYSAALLKPDFSRATIAKILIAVSTVVAALGILQYFLPKDILSHVGYGLDRGVRAAFFIDDNPQYPRIMSTLRDPNSLAAFLLLPITFISLLVARVKNATERWGLMAALAVQIGALVLTFARSALIALALSLLFAFAWQYRQLLMGFLQRFWLVLVVVLVVLGFGLYSQRTSMVYQQYIVHSSNDSDLDSNDYHRIFLERGLHGIADEPLGHGPGTAGLASIQNPKGSFLTENYYVQIGYEVGVLGLVLFLLLNGVVYLELLSQRRQALVVALLASFWGYVAMNMLLHIWSNEAVATQWWLVAGLMIVSAGSAAQYKTKATRQ